MGRGGTQGQLEGEQRAQRNAGLILRDTGVWCVRVAFTREEQLA